MQKLIAILVEYIIMGINFGSLYALFAMGLTLIFGVLGVLNAAHGMLFLIGGYIAVAAALSVGPNPLTSLVLSMVVCFVLGIAIYISLIHPLRSRTGKLESRDKEAVLVITLGLSMFLENILMLVTGGRVWRSPSFFPEIITISFIRVNAQRLLVTGIAILITVVLWFFITKTKTGLSIQAVSQDADTARAVGVDLGRVYILTFGIGALLAGVAGSLIAPITALYPTRGLTLSLRGIVIILLGGLGSIPGAIIAGVVSGMTEVMAIWAFGSKWVDAVFFVIMLLAFIIRPSGLFGKRLEQARATARA